MLPRKWRSPWSENSFAGEWRQDGTHATFAWNLGRAGVRATLGDCNVTSGAVWKAYAADWRRTGDGRPAQQDAIVVKAWPSSGRLSWSGIANTAMIVRHKCIDDDGKHVC